MPNRNRSLLELAISSNTGNTNSQVRTQLDVYSTSQVDDQINTIDLSEYTLLATTEGITADVNDNTLDISALETDVDTISGDLGSLEVLVDAISGDVSDLDLSLTEAVATLFDTTTTSATSGAATLPDNPEGFITISVDGASKKIPYYGV